LGWIGCGRWSLVWHRTRWWCDSPARDCRPPRFTVDRHKDFAAVHWTL
jgi:hypothetical protein